MVKKKWILFLLPLSMVVVMWFYAVNFIAYADFSAPYTQMRPDRRYEDGRTLNKGTIESVQFLNSPAQSAVKDVKAEKSNTDNEDTEKKKDLPAWMTVLSAIGLLGASQALKKENPVPITPKEEFEIIKVPRTIYANVTNMVDKTVEVIKKVPYTAYETAYKTVDKVIDVTREVAETVYETVKEKVVQPVTEIYDKAVTKTKQVTEYVTKQFEEVSQVAKTVLDKVERTVEKVVPTIRNVTDYVTTKVEEAYQYATQVTRDVAEWVMTPVKEAYEVVREVPRNVTEYVTEKVKQTKEVARTVYDNVERSKVWFEDKVSTVWDEVRQLKTRVVEKYEDARRWVGDTYRTVTERVWGQTGTSVSYENVPVYGMVAETSSNWIKRGWQWLKSTVTKWVSKVVGWTSRKIVQPVYGWVSRSYQQLAEAGHWVTDRVRRFVNETYTDIQRISRTIVEKVRHVNEWIEKVPRTVYDTVAEWVEKTVPVVRTVYDKVKDTAYRMVEKPVQKIKQVAETVWNTATRVVDKVVPVVRQVTDYVTEKVKEVVEVPRTIYENIVNVVEKVVPVVKDVAYTAYEKAERIVDKIVEVSKEVAKTTYRQVTEKVITPVVEAYQVAVEKLKEVKEYVTVKTPEVQQISRTVYDEVKAKKKLVEAASPVTSFMVNKVVLPFVDKTINSVVTSTGIVVGVIENVKDTVVPLATLGYNLAVNTDITVDALKNYANGVKENPVGAATDIVTGYGEDVKSKWGNGNAFNQGRATGYVGLDIISIVVSGGTIGGLKNVSKEVAEKVAREAAEKVAREATEKAAREATEKAAREAAEKAAREATEKAAREAAEKAAKETKETAQEVTEKATKEVTQEVTEKPIKEAVAQTTKEVADQAKKEAIEKAEKEAIQKAEKEAAEKAAEQAKKELLATTAKGVESAAKEMTQKTMARVGLKSGTIVQQPVHTLEGVIKLSKEIETPLNDMSRIIAGKTKGTPHIVELKTASKDGLERAEKKVARYIKEGGSAADLKDVARTAISYKNTGHMQKGLEELSKNPLFEIVEIEDRMSKPLSSGYRDIKVLVKSKKNGAIAEVQLHIDEVFKAKEGLERQIYNQVRELDDLYDITTDLVERQRIFTQKQILNAESRRIYNEAWDQFLQRISQ